MSESLQPKVSVIMPCYNSEKTINKSLISLKNQSFQDFEIIIVNDGSSDNTEKEILKFINDNNFLNVKYFKQKNKGVSVARNLGLINTKGKYVSFLDSDDMYHKNFLNKLVRVFEENDCDLVFSLYTREKNGLMESENKLEKQMKIYEHDDMMEDFMYRKMPVYFCCFMYKKQILIDNNIMFTEGVRYGEDTEFIWKYMSNCKNGIMLEDKYVYYNDNPYSVTNDISWFMVDSIESTKRVRNYLKENKDSFYKKYKLYMDGRAIWSTTIKFALARERKLFTKLIDKYNVSNAMKAMLKNNQFYYVKITAALYLISSNLFYYLMALISKANIVEKIK